MIKFVFDSPRKRWSTRRCLRVSVVVPRYASALLRSFFYTCTLLLTHPVFGQNSTPPRFGFSTGAVFQDLNIGTLPAMSPAGPFVRPAGIGAGAELGVWGQWELLPALYVRPALQFAYSSNAARFWAEDGHVDAYTYTFAEVEVPLHLLLSSPFSRLNARGIFLAGGRLSWNLASAPAAAAFQLLPERLGLDLGLGVAFAWHGWAVQPEFVYSHGLNNLHDFNNNPADRAIGRIVRDRLCLRLLLTPGK